MNGDTGTAAHHFVSRNAKASAHTKAILTKYVDIDSHWNGVFLAKKASSARGAIHDYLHSGEFYRVLSERLDDADRLGGRVGVLREMQKIRRDLSYGAYPTLLLRDIN